MYHDPILHRAAPRRAATPEPLDLTPYEHGDELAPAPVPDVDPIVDPLVAYFRDEGVRARLEAAMLILAALIGVRIAVAIVGVALGHRL